MTAPLAGEVVGDGPLVVLVHDLSESRHTWDPLVPLLATRARVLSVDLPGHGESPAGPGWQLDDVVADLHASVERAAPGSAPVLVGHGFGAFVAADYATLHPAVAVVDVDQELTGAWAAGAVAALPADADVDMVERVVLHPAGFGALDDAERARVHALRRADLDVLRAAWRPLTAPARARQAWAEEQVALPVGVALVCVLATDPGKAYVRWLRDHVRGARVEGWSPGHYPHLVEPVRFVELIVSLLPR